MVCKTILNSILIDIVEIIIVKANYYYLFEDLQLINLKLKDSKVKTRILDKLTQLNKKSFEIYKEIHYFINSLMYHREYDKPARVTKDCSYTYYDCDNFRRFNGNPFYIDVFCRHWLNKDNTDDFPERITYRGAQEWKSKNRFNGDIQLPYYISTVGIRDIRGRGTFLIFNFL